MPSCNMPFGPSRLKESDVICPSAPRLCEECDATGTTKHQSVKFSLTEDRTLSPLGFLLCPGSLEMMSAR